MAKTMTSIKEDVVAKANLTLNISDAVKEAVAKAVEQQAAITEPAAKKAKKLAVEKKQATATVEVKHPDGTTTTAEEAVGKPQFFSEPPCTVSVGAKLKLQIVKFESYAETSIHLSVPCAAGEIDEVADFDQNWVDKRMQDAAQKLEQAKQAAA